MQDRRRISPLEWAIMLVCVSIALLACAPPAEQPSVIAIPDPPRPRPVGWVLPLDGAPQPVAWVLERPR